MRRLPVYFLIDTKSEIGSEELAALNNGTNVMLSSLKYNPQLIETCHISINSLSVNSYKINELIPIENITSIKLICTESCFLGKSISLLSEFLQKQILKNQEGKGDWKPIVFILLLNEPDDDYIRHISHYKKLSHTTVVVVFNENMDIAKLTSLTENVVKGSEVDSGTLGKFFWWSEDLCISS